MMAELEVHSGLNTGTQDAAHDIAEAVATSEPSSGAALDLLRIVRINEEIKRVVSVAFKINIMALNAIFLAKRAGTAARGFGV